MDGGYANALNQGMVFANGPGEDSALASFADDRVREDPRRTTEILAHGQSERHPVAVARRCHRDLPRLIDSSRTSNSKQH
jgi:hypothetical protein